ncbi:hypothetical protein [Candidatus Marithrix sp. Canyon 246]|uniref:hypothetical protein n=1 Tax=Candidatus Marithrix sp. Canyon 246 TaxID=1827136 RepID=UPI000849F719|nr:hypothetical protein [Candidatus Marithrix sp. Canyon 246]
MKFLTSVLLLILIVNVQDTQAAYQKWYVVLGRYSETKQGYKSAYALRYKLRRYGHSNVKIINSNYYNGLIIVTMGPFFNQRKALAQRNAVKHFVLHAYIKQF